MKVMLCGSIWPNQQEEVVKVEEGGDCRLLSVTCIFYISAMLAFSTDFHARRCLCYKGGFVLDNYLLFVVALEYSF